MITDNERNYNPDDATFNPENPDNQSYVDQYQQKNSEEETSASENENLNTAFSNALELDEFEDDFDENDLEEEDPKEDKEDENYDQEEITEPETFSDDGYKID